MRYEEVNKSEYLNVCLNESMRLHPALNRLMRIAVDDCDLGKFRVKKGQVVAVSVRNLHEDPRYFSSDAREFLPERFLYGEVKSHFIPFGDGPRNCIANRFAMLELKSCLIRLLRRFKFSTNEHTMKFRYTVARDQIDENGLRLKIKRRNCDKLLIVSDCALN